LRWIAAVTYQYLEKFAKIAPGIVLVIALVGLLIAMRQSREASRARRLTATKLLLDEIGNNEVRMARTFVLEEMQDFTVDDIRDKRVAMTGDAIRNARRLGVAHDRVGIMIKRGLVDERTLYDSQKVEIKEIWRKIEPMVPFVRSDLKRDNYMYHFEYLATVWLRKMKSRQLKRST
jgi:hypothetical protein